MANVIARARGFNKDGSPKAGEATRLGHSSVTVQANTWRTFVETTTWADGHAEVIIKRDGKIIATVRVNAEDSPDAVVELLNEPWHQPSAVVRQPCL